MTEQPDQLSLEVVALAGWPCSDLPVQNIDETVRKVALRPL